MEILFCFSHSFSPRCILTNVFLSLLTSSSLKVFEAEEAEGNPCFQFLFKFYGFLIFPLISPATGNLDFACDNNFTCYLDLTCNQDSTCNQATIPHFLVPSSDLTHKDKLNINRCSFCQNTLHSILLRSSVTTWSLCRDLKQNILQIVLDTFMVVTQYLFCVILFHLNYYKIMFYKLYQAFYPNVKDFVKFSLHSLLWWSSVTSRSHCRYLKQNV